MRAFRQAINEALHEAMARDDRTFIMGEGVDDPKLIFGSTAGLKERFGPERVFDIPLSENGMTGVIIGAALAGMRPIMTHQRIDFTLYAMDQIANHAAKRCYASGGRQSVPITIRALVGCGWGQGPQHSQSLQSVFAHIPGLKVVMPSSAYDAKGLLISSIEDNNPVIFIEHRRLYEIEDDVPDGHYKVPLGRGVVKCEGKDVTVVAVSLMVFESIRARQALAEAGIDAEIVDPRTIKPLDVNLILESVRKTGRLVIVDTAWKTCGFSAEIAALAAEECFGALKAPIRRVTLPDVPTPTTSALEKIYYPGALDIARAACDVMGLGGKVPPAVEASIAGMTTPTAPQFFGPF
ncbi:MAG: acetoin dehydrogenase [Candidatus Lindowbacteria bacterium RIFCSPLOWO2_12_FULL_62_27]|nr:MAG: acetoin dehydrogenase [Candidatus Lindowbacteria bacterium RIFCSPLOWO2_02_FULL_62_12]OGH60927.1 MAG: acetoin dehydrogenase [Candidatus Lindowbacteria bacterium RIFCSPLOWO2_12_FULL_62_27]